MSEALITKYRPQTLDDVVGNNAAINSLAATLEKNRARTFLFTGGSGMGKTTLAYIAAKMVGCTPHDIEDVDAATNTGIDDMRRVAEDLSYRPIGSKVKAVIVDECHMLSKAAWNSLLKITEKPPEWAYWFFCTTEPSKAPKAIHTRSFKLDLKPLTTRQLIEIIAYICKEEKQKVHPDIQALCAKEAQGSPRQAISNLAVCFDAGSVEEARELLHSAEESVEAIDLARLLFKNPRWSDCCVVLNKIKEKELNPESVRHVVRAYATTVALAKWSKEGAQERAILVNRCFLTPFSSYDGVSPLVDACARVLFDD